jgi:hypothetical protein
MIFVAPLFALRVFRRFSRNVLRAVVFFDIGTLPVAGTGMVWRGLASNW